MFKFESDLYKIISNICELINLKDRVYVDDLPVNFNFKNNVGIYYKINNIQDSEYKKESSLDITFVCRKEEKIKMLEILGAFDEKLNKKVIDNYFITHKLVYLIPVKDGDYYYYTLSYNINCY